MIRAVFFGLGADGTVGAEQEFNQDYRRRNGELRPGLLRLRLQEVRRYDDLASALRTETYPFRLSDPLGQLCRLPPIRLLGKVRCPRLRQSRGCVSLERAVRPETRSGTDLPREVQEANHRQAAPLLCHRRHQVARETGMGGRINTIMQTCFFAVSGVLPRERSHRPNQEIHRKDLRQRRETKLSGAILPRSMIRLAQLFEVKVPGNVTATTCRPRRAPEGARLCPPRDRRDDGRQGRSVAGVRVSGRRHLAVGTARWEKRTIADGSPVWDPDVCIQCNKCAMVCPHAAIRAKVYEPRATRGRPASFQSTDYRGAEFKDWKYTIQVAPQDCTGCNLCVMVCPAKDKSNPRHKAINMTPLLPILERRGATTTSF